MLSEKPKTQLGLGNRALIEGRYPEAVMHYLKMLTATPEISHIVLINLVLARKRYQRRSVKNLDTIICGEDLFGTKNFRINTLVDVYSAVDNVQIVDWTFAAHNKAKRAEVISHNFPICCLSFHNQASLIEICIEFVAYHPSNRVHLLGIQLPNILLGTLYKLLWDAAVFVDIDHDERAAANLSVPLTLVEFERNYGKILDLGSISSVQWLQLAVGLITEFDGVSVSSFHLQQSYGGEIIKADQHSKQKWLQTIEAVTRKRLSTLLAILVLPSGSAYRHLLDLPSVLYPADPATKSSLRSYRNSADYPERFLTEPVQGLLSHEPLEIKATDVIDWRNESNRKRRKGLVSIVIPVDEDQSPDLLCFEALFQFTPVNHFELIIVESGCDGKIRQKLKLLAAQHPNVRMLESPKRQSFASSCHQGFLASAGEIFLLLGQNTLVSGEWLPPLMAAMEQPHISSAQPWVLNDDGSICDIGTVFSDKNHHGYPIYVGQAPDQLADVCSRTYQAISGPCMALRANDFVRIAGFDAVHAGRDAFVDLSLRLNRETRGQCCAVRESIVRLIGLKISSLDFKNVGSIDFAKRWQGKIKSDDKNYYKSDGFDFTRSNMDGLADDVNLRPALIKAVRKTKDFISLPPFDYPIMLAAFKSDYSRIPLNQNVLSVHDIMIGRVLSSQHDDPGHPDQHKLEVLADFLRLSNLEPENTLHLIATKHSKNYRTSICIGQGNLKRVSLAESFGGIARLADIWYCADYKLRLRLEGLATKASVKQVGLLVFHQIDPVSGKLRTCHEQVICGDSIVLVDVQLFDPFWPVLITMLAADGTLCDIRFLPFPSLARGGVHYSEMFFAGLSSDYIGDLAARSADLLDAWAASTQVLSSGLVTGIEIDVTAANGSELLLSSPMMGWLRNLFNLELRLKQPKDGAVVSEETLGYLAESIRVVTSAARDPEMSVVATTPARDNPQCWLSLPAHAVPTIQALVAERPVALPFVRQAGSLIVARPVDHAPLLLLKLPAIDADLLLQDAGKPCEWPLLDVAVTTAMPAKNAATTPDYPLSINFHTDSKRSAASILFPIAPDAAAPLLASGSSGDQIPNPEVSVLVQLTSGLAQLENLLIALVLQRDASIREIIVVAANNLSLLEIDIQAVLAKHFNGPCFVQQQGISRLPKAMAKAASTAKGEFMLFLDDSVILHDARSLVVLARLCSASQVATVGCHLIMEPSAEKNSEWSLFAAGYGGAAELARDATGVVKSLAALTNPGLLSGMTYPVAANSQLLFMLRARVWKQLGSLYDAEATDEKTRSTTERKRLMHGFTNLCTGLFSATLQQSSLQPGMQQVCGIAGGQAQSLRLISGLPD